MNHPDWLITGWDRFNVTYKVTYCTLLGVVPDLKIAILKQLTRTQSSSTAEARKSIYEWFYVVLTILWCGIVRAYAEECSQELQGLLQKSSSAFERLICAVLAVDNSLFFFYVALLSITSSPFSFHFTLNCMITDAHFIVWQNGKYIWHLRNT